VREKSIPRPDLLREAGKTGRTRLLYASRRVHSKLENGIDRRGEHAAFEEKCEGTQQQ
jgi:hypothetical protein